MAQAVILGSGTSNGVPMLGMDYSPEFLANPKNHRTRPSLLLEGPTGNVLVDCPPELRLQLLRESCKRLEAVILTHTHADHLMGMDDLRSYCLVQKQDMPVYTLPEYQQDVRRVFNYAFQDHRPGIHVPRFDLRDVPESLFLGGLEIRTMTVFHGHWPVIAIRVNDFAYVTDVNRIPEEAWNQLQNLETLVLDATRYASHPTHFSFEEALSVARTLKPSITYLTHLSADYDHDKVEAQLEPAIRLAYDGLRISL